jgi:hypothetical protein
MSTTAFRKEVKHKEGTGDELTTVRGIVIPVDWDGEGNPLAVAILGAGEEEHFVEQDEEGKELLELTQQEVEISGTARETIQGHKVIKVKSYALKSSDWQQEESLNQ